MRRPGSRAAPHPARAGRPGHRSRRAAAVAVLLGLACAACRPASAPEAATARTTTEPDFDAGIEVAYLTQGVQDRAGTVPLLAGRPALLRIFLRAIERGAPVPAVRARLVETATGAVLRSWTPGTALTELPTALFEASRGASWNVAVAGEDVHINGPRPSPKSSM